MELSDLEIVNADKAAKIYTRILTSVMEFIVKRYNTDPSYGWVDTKISLITGLDYLEDDFFRGKNTVYGWIQGRALEALTYHGQWFERRGINKTLVADIKEILANVLSRLEHAREINGGHLFFFMDKQGRAFRTNTDRNIEYIPKGTISIYNLSDLFCSKGMYAAAKYLGLDEAAAKAERYCLDVADAVWNSNFASDQFSFRGRIASSGCILNSIGPYMLLLDTADMLLAKEPRAAVNLALPLIRRIISKHINLQGNWDFGCRYDCVENITAHEKPSVIDGAAESDPGHSIEFTGLALKFISNAKESDISEHDKTVLNEFADILIQILIRNFSNGYVKEIGGICKGFDLISRNIADEDMPWWSLPETMRASLYAIEACDDYQTREELRDIYYKSHLAFINNYLRPELAFMSVQTLGKDGMVKDTIPATPDADPGYHTGICLIDCLKVMEDFDFNMDI